MNHWRASFGDLLPAAFICRRTLTNRWLRIHSLPDSKRYAVTSAERNELLSRQNTVASHVLGEGEKCELVFIRFGENTAWSPSEAIPLKYGVPRHVLSADDNGEELQFFALSVVWRKAAFNELILAKADDRIGPVLFASVRDHSIYAPYDGGADLFFSSPGEVAVARSKFQHWLSVREDGL